MFHIYWLHLTGMACCPPPLQPLPGNWALVHDFRRFQPLLATAGFHDPLQPSTTPKIEHDARFGGFSTSLGFDLPRQPPKSSAMLGLGFFLISLGINLPPRPSTIPEIEHDARFQPPWLWQPSTTSEIERDAWFGGLSTFLGFDNSRQPPKSSAMLSLGGFQPPWASTVTSLHDPRQPLKSSTMLGFGGFRPHYCIILVDCTYAPAIYYFLGLLFCAISDKSHLNNKNSVLFCTTLDQLHSTLYCPMPDL